MRHLIVGASAAGLAAADAILTRDATAEVTILSEEPDPPYCRPLISYWLARETPDSLFALPSEFLARTELRLACRAAAILPAVKRLRRDSGEELGYDRLLLATGAASTRVGLGGEEAANVRGFRSREDARAIDAELARGAEKAVILGGGLVGVKAAHALAARGLCATLAIASEHPLSQVVDRVAGDLIAEALAEEGVRVRTGVSPTSFDIRDGRVRSVTFSDGSSEPCDLVVVGKGVVPRTELFAGLGVDVSAGVPVDQTLRTPWPDVWAAGDAALTYDVAWSRPRLTAIWPMAVEQGGLAGRNMAGADEAYPGSLAMNSLRIGRLHVVSAGITRPPDSTYEERSVTERARGTYRKIVTKHGRLVGTIFAGDPEQAGMVVTAIRCGARLEDIPFDPLERGIHWGRYAFG